LRIGRRGKHHDLLAGILSNLESLPAGSAPGIPLSSVGKISPTNFRSAVSRAGKAHELSLVTCSDDKNFYIWERRKDQTPPSRQPKEAQGRTRKRLGLLQQPPKTTESNRLAGMPETMLALEQLHQDQRCLVVSDPVVLSEQGTQLVTMLFLFHRVAGSDNLPA